MIELSQPRALDTYRAAFRAVIDNDRRFELECRLEAKSIKVNESSRGYEVENCRVDQEPTTSNHNA